MGPSIPLLPPWFESSRKFFILQKKLSLPTDVDSSPPDFINLNLIIYVHILWTVQQCTIMADNYSIWQSLLDDAVLRKNVGAQLCMRLNEFES